MRKGFHFDEEEDCVARPRDRPGRSAAHGRRRPRGRARRAGRRQVRARGRLRRRARVRGREEQRAAPVARQVRQGRHRPRGHPQSRRHPGHRRRPEAGHKHRAQLRGRRVRHPGRLPRVVHPDRAGRLHLPLHRQHQGPEDRPEVHLVAHHLRRGPGPVPGAVPGQGAEWRAAQHPPGPRGPAARPGGGGQPGPGPEGGVLGRSGAGHRDRGRGGRPGRPGGGRLRPAEAGVGTMGRAAIGRRLIVVAALAGTALLLAAPAAGAHALLRSSDPASGASVGKAPAKVTLNFTEAPDPALSSVHVLDSTGKAVGQGRAHAVPGRPLALEVAVGQLGNGAYTVSWRVVSRSDGHLTAGAFAFGVGVQAPSAVSGGGPAAVASPSPSPLAVAGRWALDWGLILLVGAAASGLLVFRARRRAAGPSLPLLSGALALAAAGLAASVAAEHARVGVSFGDLLASTTGGKIVGQAVVLVATAVVLVAMARWPGRQELLGLLGAGAAAAMLVHVAAGHAAGSGSLGPLNLLAQWVHLLAVGVWVGGFLWLVLGIRATAAGEESEKVVAVQRFSRMATVAVGLVLVTGLARALVEVGSWHGLLDTNFGRTLLVKGGLVAGLVAIGAANRFRIVPALRAGRAKLQTLAATVLVGRPGGAVTVPLQLQTRSAEPPRVRVSHVPGQPTVYTIALAQAGSLQAYLDPGRPGRNVLHLTYFDPRGAELPISGARASATTPSGAPHPLTLQLFSSGHFVANLDLTAGRWSFAVQATTTAGVATNAQFEQVIEQ